MLSESKKISVIVPVYNVEPYLHRCMDSIINNTYRNLEIICVNDGSPDHCLDILNDYAERDSRVTVIDKPNGGVSSARNAGLAIATGDYVAMIDSDDWVHKSYFEVLVNYAEIYNADISVCGFIRTSEIVNDVPIDYKNIHSYEVSGLKMLDDDPVTHGYACIRLYKRRIIGKQLFSNLTIQEDAAFNFDILSAHEGIKCAVCDAKLYYYYRNPNSLMTNFGSENTRQLTEYYYSKFIESSSIWQRYVYAIEILKNSINYRYAVMFQKTNKQLYCNNQRMMREALAEINASSFSTVKIKTIYRLMTAFPPLYRAFRIVTDPTMLDWEKNQKAMRKKDNG